MIIFNSKHIADAPEDIRNLIGNNDAILILEPESNGKYGIDPNDVNYSLNVYTR